MIDWGLIAARLVHYTALVLTFGGFSYAGLVRLPDVHLRRKMQRLVVGSSILVVAAAVAVLVATIAGLGEGYASLSDAILWSAVLEETDFGQIWSARLVLALILVVTALAWSPSHSRLLAALGLLVTAAMLITLAWTGHAAIEMGASGTIHRAADAVHLLSAAVWLGALLPLLLLLRAAERESQMLEPAAGRLTAFHNIGLAAVLLLLATGLINGWFLVGSVDRLVSTDYGRLLILKALLFAAMIALAAWNRLVLVPRLVSGNDQSISRTSQRLQWHIKSEFCLGLLVLAAVAILGAIEPAAGS